MNVTNKKWENMKSKTRKEKAANGRENETDVGKTRKKPEK